MKIELKPFQDIAARDIISELNDARMSVDKGKLQAVVLSAPTGSGKTITVAQVIDLTFGGGEGIPSRPETVFLWLSDSPELNQQSKSKLLGACDHLPFHKMLTIDSENFNENVMQPGHVYFINTQLLGKDKRLTQEGGDGRAFTFWHTVSQTILRSPRDFVLIIDEAHRGASASDRTRTPIMQKFILGSPSDGLPPVPLVLGMSATPQRFTMLLGNTNRTHRPINIDPEEVRSSGLLKDWIIVRNPKAKVKGDLTLLESAAAKWVEFSDQWKKYCAEQRVDRVRPILVVQVEDGNASTITATPLDDVVRVIERKVGVLAVNEIVHCFQESHEIVAGGRIIRKIDASRIQESSEVKVVLFKTALTTGWDCPRAEVMMSFRRAQDATHIAQLVGRMIRTPLAARVGSNEVLDTVELYLPHFEPAALEEVLRRLRSPEAEEGVGTRVETAAAAFARNPALAECFEAIEKLVTHVFARVPPMTNLKRVLRLTGLLVHEGVNPDADEQLRDVFLAKLKSLRDEAAGDKDWGAVVKEGGEIEIDVTRVSTGKMYAAGTQSAKITLSSENIEKLFESTGRVLAAGEGLHVTYWRRFHEKCEPNKVKLELYALMSRPETSGVLEKLAGERFEALWASYEPDIRGLPAAVRAKFQILVRASGKATPQPWGLPERIVERLEEQRWEQHLYCDEHGKFPVDFNGWEREILTREMANPGFAGWLRNMPRRDWAFCVPYELGGEKAFYPDFVILRKERKEIVVDIVEPHDDSRADTWAKAKGLAKFADDYGDRFGRLIIARKKGKLWQYANLNLKSFREKARRMQSQSDLESLFT